MMKKDIKRFLISISFFIPFTVILYLLLVILGGNMPFQFLKPNVNYRIGSKGHMHTRINEIKNYKNIDILFLGSSHAYRGFNTEIFNHKGLKTFNLGSSSQTPIQTDVLLQRYLDTLNPKKIIIEVSPMYFMSDGVEASTDLIANDKNDLLILTNLIKWNNLKTINTSIYSFYRNVFNLDKYFIEKKDKGDEVYIKGGFVDTELLFYKPEKHTKQKIILNDKQVLVFEEIIKQIHKNNIELILIQAPVTHALYTSYTNTDYFDNTMRAYGKYYNFNTVLNFNDTLHFYDSHHLNKNGVVIFNTEVINFLGL